MKVKDKVAEILRKNPGKYISGEELAAMIGCTRGAVWKAIKSLQESGLGIDAVTNKGYCLTESADILSADGVMKYLHGAGEKLNVEVFKSVGSTNDVAKEYASKGCEEGKVIMAAMQTKGKGRLGRRFESPDESGIYMSIVLRPKMTADKAIKITTAAAVAVALAVEKISGRKTDIKWVNDVLINERKICGILTEASFGLENGGLEYAVLGIGVNAYEPENGFADEIKDIAGAVFDKKSSDLRNKLSAEILSIFMEYYNKLSENTFYEEYRSRLMWLGEDIVLISGSRRTPARLIDVDKDCKIKVQYPNGEYDLISSGEISIRASKNL